MENDKAIEIYRSKDGKVELSVTLENETIWLTQKQMANLFGKSIKTVNEHVINIYKERELAKHSTIRKFRIVQTEGKRKVDRQIEAYNLDVIISVGYRVKSQRGTDFRIWATNVLKQFLVNGYLINEKLLKAQKNKIDELRDNIRGLLMGPVEEDD
jgi:hypothetical protein